MFFMYKCFNGSRDVLTCLMFFVVILLLLRFIDQTAISKILLYFLHTQQIRDISSKYVYINIRTLVARLNLIVLPGHGIYFFCV